LLANLLLKMNQSAMKSLADADAELHMSRSGKSARTCRKAIQFGILERLYQIAFMTKPFDLDIRGIGDNALLHKVTKADYAASLRKQI
jgi:hypothetical protein